MATAEDTNVPCSLSTLDSLAEGAMVQEDILDASYIKIKATGFSRDATTYEFNVESAEDYYDVRRTELMVKFRITRPDGTNLQAGDRVTVANYPIASLFHTAELWLGSEPVAHQGSNYAVRGYFEILTSYGRDAQESYLQAALWYRDTAGQMDNANHTPVNEQNVIQPHNVGLKNRSEWTNESKLVTVIGKLHFDFFHQPKPLVNNVSMKVKLHRNDAKYVLISSDANVEYKVLIEDIALICRRQTVSPRILEAAADGVSYPLYRIIMRDLQVPAGVESHPVNNFCSGVLPTKVLMGFVRSEAKQGDYRYNPFNFQHFNVSSIHFKINGQMVNGEALKMNYANDDVAQGFWSLMRMKKNRDEGINLERKDYKNGFALYAYDLSVSECDDQYRDKKQSGVGEIEFFFSVPTPHNLTLCCYFQYDSEIRVNDAGAVVPLFKEK